MPTAWSGRNRLLADFGLEESQERERWSARQEEAESAREKEGKDKNIWSLFATGLCLGAGGGPACIPIGQAVGNVAKMGAVDESKSVMDITDIGSWNRSTDKANLEALNRQFKSFDVAELSGSILDMGKSLLFAGKYGGLEESMEDPDNIFNPFTWGQAEQDSGQFGKTTKDLWDEFWRKK